MADKAAVAHGRTSGADSNNVVGRGNAVAGANAYGRVVTAGGVASKRKITVRRVVTAGGVAEKSVHSDGSVGFAGSIE